jgi:hypothetical protein
VTVNWADASATPSDLNWIGLYVVGDPLSNYISGNYTNGTTGNYQVTMPTTLGQYEFRFLLNDVDSAHSGPVTVNNVSTQKFPRLVMLTALEGFSAIPANQPVTATILSGSSVLETQNLAPNAAKQYTVTFLASDPQFVNIRIKAAGYLSQLLSGVDTTVNSATPLSVPQLLAGDLNNDNTINSLDYSAMNANWLIPGVGGLNGDGIVNSLDFAILKNNFGKSGQ